MKAIFNNKSGTVGSTIRGTLGSGLFVGAAILGFLSTNQAQVQTCTPPPPNMLSWWPGDGNANDIQGSDNGSLQNGVAFVPGMVGQAFSFDGVDDKVFINDIFPFHVPQDVTLDFWLKFTPSTHQAVFWTRPDDTDADRFNIYVNGDGTFGFDYRSPDGTLHPLISGIAIAPDTWTHLAITRVGSVYSLYTNGVLVASATDDFPDLPTSSGWQFSGRSGYIYHGLLDEVEIFSRALSQPEIQAIYNAGSAGKCKAPPYSAKVQQPINADGTSIFTAKRGVIPVKFILSQGGVATCNLPPATIAVTRTAGASPGTVNESIYSMAADSGSNFKISSCQYNYNLAGSSLGAGTYRVDIKINGTVVGSATFTLN